MSSYKIYAKKGRKVMPIKIEQKHIYSHTFTTNSESQLYVYKPVSTNTEDNTVGYGINQNNIKVLYNTNTLTLPQGVGESQRVGNKVNIKRVAITLYVRFNSERLIAAFSHGVGGEEVEGVAVYDDFRDSDMSAKEFINFIDYNIHNLNYKGGSAKNKYELIIITSVQNPEDIYKGVKGEPRKQWLRRLKIINLNQILKHNEDRDDL